MRKFEQPKFDYVEIPFIDVLVISNLEKNDNLFKNPWEGGIQW